MRSFKVNQSSKNWKPELSLERIRDHQINSYHTNYRTRDYSMCHDYANYSRHDNCYKPTIVLFDTKNQNIYAKFRDAVSHFGGLFTKTIERILFKIFSIWAWYHAPLNREGFLKIRENSYKNPCNSLQPSLKISCTNFRIFFAVILALRVRRMIFTHGLIAMTFTIFEVRYSLQVFLKK